MVEECIHICENGHKCRRIPKRGLRFCPAHRPSTRRRRPMEEDADFTRQALAYSNRLRTMSLEDLLSTTANALAAIHPLIDRCSSRRHRIAFLCATTADSIAATMAGYRQHPATIRQAQSVAAPAPQQQQDQPLDPSLKARFAQAAAALEHGPQLSPEQLEDVCTQLITILDSNATTDSTLNSNT